MEEREPIAPDELEEQDAELIPDREVMSTIDPTGEPVPGADPAIWDLPVEPRDGV